MNQTDTPETDAEERNEYGNQGQPLPDTIVDSDFARKLERERDVARLQRDKAKRRIEWMKENYVCEGRGT